MKFLKHSCLGLLAAVISLPCFAKVEKFILDPQHSYVSWSIDHMGFSTQTGKWFVNGNLTLDKDHPENSQVQATIEIADLITGIPELDKHLKEKIFFDAAQFPKATFTSTKVTLLSDKSAKVFGNLTLHGITKPIILDVSLNKVDKNPINDKMTAGFSAVTILKRSEFGINAFAGKLGDEVHIKIGAEAYHVPSNSI